MTKELYKKNKLNFVALLFCALFETGGLIVISLFLERVLAVATTKDINALYEHGILFLIYILLIIIFYIFKIIVKPRFRKRAMSQYKNKIYNKILEKNIDSFNTHETSSYISALTNDAHYIEENYLFSTFDIITHSTLFIASLVVMFIYSWQLSLVAIGFSLLPLVATLIVGSKLSDCEKNISEENANFMHFTKDNFVGFSTIKVFQSENKIKKLFNRKNEKLESVKLKRDKINNIIECLQMVTQLIAQFGVFFIGAYLCIKGNLEASVLVLFVQLMNYIISPLATVPAILSKSLAAKPLFERIENILKEEDKLEKEEVSFNENIMIENLSFSYDEKQILKNINLNLKMNKSYAIVGTSGSGKSTLLNLLCGRNQNYEGMIKYDDKELKGISLASLYTVLSYVEQNVFVFDDTIINNITMFSDVEQNVLNDVINKSGLKSLLEEKGEDYKCGENGCNLSGGEKQRISIARALLKNAKIILMDESTSALDNETSNSIMNNIFALNDLTKLIITHDLDENILIKFDEIIVLAEGCVVERGTFNELLNNKGVFYSLFNINK